jgi:hypothetical protein
MQKRRYRFPRIPIIILGLMLGALGAGDALGSVVVFDRVAVMGKSVRLVVQTRARFFPDGGRLVNIAVDDQPPKRIMTGGDGYGYLAYSPQQPGLINISARTQDSSATGYLLVMQPEEKAVLVEIESAVQNTLFSQKNRRQATAALGKLRETFRLIYLVRYLGSPLARRWLTGSDFPASVVLDWRGRAMVTDWQEKGLRLYALIGSQSLIEAAGDLIENRFVLNGASENETTADWEEIAKQLAP